MLYEVKNLSFTYNGDKEKTLDNCSLSLGEGEILTILGPNGAGKSTLLNCMCGLLNYQAGEIRLCGDELKSLRPKEIASRVGYVQQNNTPVFGYSVFHYVLMGSAPRVSLLGKPSPSDRKKAYEALCSLGIEALANKPYTEISGGERQQAQIARAIVQEPKVILFDEPTAHLDFGKQLVILRRIKDMAKMGYGAVMTTHNPNHAILLGGRVAILKKDGTLEIGHAKSLLTEEKLKSIYKTELKISYVDSFGREVCGASHL